MGSIPTVTIRADNAKGRKIINEADYDPKRHEIWREEAEAPKGRPVKRARKVKGDGA